MPTHTTTISQQRRCIFATLLPLLLLFQSCQSDSQLSVTDKDTASDEAQKDLDPPREGVVKSHDLPPPVVQRDTLPILAQSLPNTSNDALPLSQRQIKLLSTAFGVAEWKEYFEAEVPEASPESTEAALRAWREDQAPFLLEDEDYKHPVRENHLLTLIPAKVNGEPFTLDKLGELILANHDGHMDAFKSNSNKELGQNSHGYRYYSKHLTSASRTEPLSDSSYWLLFPKTILSDSRKNSLVYEKLISDFGAGYRLPCTLEVATLLIAHYARRKERLYAKNGKDWWTYTRCSDLDKDGGSLFVGGFGATGLSVSGGSVYDSSLGVACCRKF